MLSPNLSFLRNQTKLSRSRKFNRFSHVLWNVSGGDSNDLSPEVYRARLQVGDTLLLCSDGLTKHVSDAEIASVLGMRMIG